MPYAGHRACRPARPAPGPGGARTASGRTATPPGWPPNAWSKASVQALARLLLPQPQQGARALACTRSPARGRPGKHGQQLGTGRAGFGHASPQGSQAPQRAAHPGDDLAGCPAPPMIPLAGLWCSATQSNFAALALATVRPRVSPGDCQRSTCRPSAVHGTSNSPAIRTGRPRWSPTLLHLQLGPAQGTEPYPGPGHRERRAGRARWCVIAGGPMTACGQAGARRSARP
jgi:hypothetical protein